MNSGASSVPGWLVFVGSTLVALVAVGGMVALLILRIPVPGELWGLVSVIGLAYFGAAPFHQSIAHAQATEARLIELSHHNIQLAQDVLAHSTQTTKTAA